MSKVRSLYFLAVLFLTIVTFSVSNCASIFGDDANEPEASPLSEVRVLYSENTKSENGYKFVYELSDGQGREEVGTIHNPGTDQEYLEVVGYYRYTGPDQFTYRVNYKSGPDGYEAMTSRYKTGRNRISPVALKSLVG